MATRGRLLTDNYEFVQPFDKLKLEFDVAGTRHCVDVKKCMDKINVNDKLLLSIPVILTSMPIATNAAIMANKYKANESLASQLVFLSALLSIITIPFISFLFIR